MVGLSVGRDDSVAGLMFVVSNLRGKRIRIRQGTLTDLININARQVGLHRWQTGFSPQTARKYQQAVRWAKVDEKKKDLQITSGILATDLGAHFVLRF